MTEASFTKKPPPFTLTPKEDELMNVLVSHFIDFYFEDPERFLKPVLIKKSKKAKNGGKSNAK